MFNVSEVYALLNLRKLNIFREVSYRSSDDTILLYCDKGLVVERSVVGKISRRQLIYVENLIKNEFKKNCEIILFVDKDKDYFEKSLLIFLKSSFEKVDSLSLSFDSENKIRVLVCCSDISNVDEYDLKNHLSEYLSQFELELAGFELSGNEPELPSMFVLLRLIKIHQPIDFESVRQNLISYSDVDEKWLKGSFDRLRKSGLIVWQKEGVFRGYYALTSKGLEIVPAGKNYRSSDIDRALALSKRLWSNKRN